MPFGWFSFKQPIQTIPISIPLNYMRSTIYPVILSIRSLTIYYAHLLESCHVSITIIVRISFWKEVSINRNLLSTTALDIFYQYIHRKCADRLNRTKSTSYVCLLFILLSFGHFPFACTSFRCRQFSIFVCASIRASKQLFANVFLLFALISTRCFRRHIETEVMDGGEEE